MKQEESRKKNVLEKWYIMVGIVVGFLLLLIGCTFYVFTSQGIVSFYMGLGLILGSFGTKANIRYKNWVLSGGGAIGLIIFLIVQNVTMENVTFGMINGPFTAKTQIIIEDSEEILGAMRGKSRKVFHFVIKGEKLHCSQLSVDIGGKTFAIDHRFIDPNLCKNRPIEWLFDSTKNIIIDMQSKDTIGHLKLIGYKNDLPFGVKNALSPVCNLIFGICYADTPDSIDTDIIQYINGLGSENLRVSKESIKMLTQGNLSIIPQLMETYRNPTANEKVRANIIKVLASLYQKYQNTFVSMIDDHDLVALIQTSRIRDGIDALYAKMFIDTLESSQTIFPRIGWLTNQLAQEQLIGGSLWKIADFSGKIRYFTLNVDHSVLYGETPDENAKKSEQWQWLFQDSALSIRSNEETLTIDLRLKQYEKNEAVATKKNQKKATWAQQMFK